jgi:hypothetical protein
MIRWFRLLLLCVATCVFLKLLDCDSLIQVLGHHEYTFLVIPLATLAKQTAEGLHTGVWKLHAQRRHCLATPFFKMFIPTSLSAISISVSYCLQLKSSDIPIAEISTIVVET